MCKPVECCSSCRYVPPHVRQQQQLDAPASNSVAPPDSVSPAPPHAVTASSIDSANETADSRKEKRRHRQGHAAYTAPPLLTKRSTSQPAGVSTTSCVYKPGLCICTVKALAVPQCYRQNVTLLAMWFSLTLQTGSITFEWTATHINSSMFTLAFEIC